MKMKKKAIALVALPLLIAAATASALVLEAGDLIVNANGGFAPTKLPKTEDAPIKIYGGGKASTKSGELPPIVDTLKSNSTATGTSRPRASKSAGRASCSRPPCRRRARPVPTRSSARAKGKAIVAFPEQKPIPISSPITLFNGPKKGGNDTILAHAFTTVPVPTTFIVPVVIEKISHGVYGYRTKAKIPKIAGGAGHPISGHITVDRKWTFKGRKYSYVNARCETGHLQAKVKVMFKDETFLTGTFFKRCSVRH